MGETTKKKRSAAKIWAVILIVFTAGMLLGSGTVVWWHFMASPPAAVHTGEPASLPAPSPTPEPARNTGGYLACPDGLFYPERAMTLAETAQALERAAGETVDYTGDGDAPLTETAFAAFLAEHFPREQVSAAMESITNRGDETVTRAEAAVCLNVLLDLPVQDGGDAVFLDVEPEHWARSAILTAAACPADLELTPTEEGYLWVDGALYCLGEDGYVLKNRHIGSLAFGPDGRYTSGNAELDGYVAAVIREQTGDAMTREERLRTVYEYVRDNFTYLRRNYYNTGDVGWQVQEALTMFSTGQGNCYCYAAAFWSLARGLGYDAKIVSGTVAGADGGAAPHGWVEFMVDGQRITYDVEMEMARWYISNDTRADFYAMTDLQRMRHGYRENTWSDDLVPRDINDGLVTR